MNAAASSLARGSWSSSLCAEAPSLRATGDQARARATPAVQSTYYSISKRGTVAVNGIVELEAWNGRGKKSGVNPGTDWRRRLADDSPWPARGARWSPSPRCHLSRGRVHVRRSGRPRRAAYGHRSTTLQPRAITIRKRDMCSSGSDRLLVEKKGRSIRVRGH